LEALVGMRKAEEAAKKADSRCMLGIRSFMLELELSFDCS